MKNATFSKILLGLAIAMLWTSCQTADDSDDIDPITADSYDSLNDLVQELKLEGDTFTFDPTVSQTITGSDGTEISIDANAFTDGDGNTITTPITVNLKEYLTLEDMILGNAQTSSNNQILVTGGSFDLTFQDENGNDVNVSPFSLQATIPIQTDLTGFEDDMRYYTGEREVNDGREMVDWELFQNSEFRLSDNLFTIFGLEQGLANCDVLFDLAGENPTQFEVTVSDVSDYNSTTVWMVIEDFPSVIMITQLNDDMTALKTYDNSVPVGLNATLIAITVDDDSFLKFGSLPVEVLGDDVFNIDVDYGTTEELRDLIQTVTN